MISILSTMPVFRILPSHHDGKIPSSFVPLTIQNNLLGASVEMCLLEHRNDCTKK